MLGGLLDFLTNPWFSIFRNFKIKELFGSGLIGGERNLEWKNLWFHLFQKLKEPSVFMKQKLAKNLGYLGGSFIILLFYGSFISESVLCFSWEQWSWDRRTILITNGGGGFGCHFWYPHNTLVTDCQNRVEAKTVRESASVFCLTKTSTRLWPTYFTLPNILPDQR